MTEPYFSLGMASWREKMMKALYRIFHIPKVSKKTKKTVQKKILNASLAQKATATG